MNVVYHLQAKEMYDSCLRMASKCCNRINNGPSECRMCLEFGSECAAMAMMMFLDADYVRRGGDLLLLHAQKTKDGKVRIFV